MEQAKFELIDFNIIKRERLRKRILLLLVAIGVVIVSVISGACVNSISKKKQEEAISQEEIKTDEIEEEKEAKKIPIYSEEAKERMKNIYEAPNDGKVAYLTFDDGPSGSVTPQILEILKNEGIKATFFVLGSRVELYPEILKQEYDEGHYIANHGYSHVYTSVYSSPTAVLDEYNNTEIKIKEVLGEEYSSHLFRFPGGSEGGRYKKIKNEAKSLLEQNNIAYVNWNALTNDSVGKPTYESLVSDLKLTASGKNSIVVLMHDTGAKQLTADSLTEIIHYLKEQGYCFKNFYDIMY